MKASTICALALATALAACGGPGGPFLGLPTPAPTAMPSAGATSTPSPPPPPGVGFVQLSTSTLAFVLTGAAGAASVQIAQSGYAGAFTVGQSSCAGIASVAISNATALVTPIGAGTCSVQIVGLNSSAALSISVTTTTLGVN